MEHAQVSNLSEILNLPNHHLSHSQHPITIQHPCHDSDSQKLKNRKSHIRYTNQSNIIASIQPPLPPLPPLPPPVPQQELQNKTNSLLISRPSFIGDLQTLTAYYQNENNLNQFQSSKKNQITSTKPKSILKPNLPTKKSINQTKSTLNPIPETSNPQSEFNPSTHHIQFQPNRSQEKSKSTYPIQSQPNRSQPERSKSTYPIQLQPNPSEDEPKPVQPIQFQPFAAHSQLEDDPLGLAPKLELPFFGVNQHIGCRFSVRTLTREVERSLKSHEPMPPKKYQETQIKRHLTEEEKSSVLNRTRQDLGLSPRHYQTHLDSIVECYYEEPNGTDEEQFELDEDDDDQTKWSKVERILSRLPNQLPDLAHDDDPNGSSGDSSKSSVSSIESPPLKVTKQVQQTSLKNEEPLKALTYQLNSRKSEAPQRVQPIGAQEPKNSRKTIQVSTPKADPQLKLQTFKPPTTSSTSTPTQTPKQAPVLVPQPWGRARDQRRQTQAVPVQRTTRYSEFNPSSSSSRNSKKFTKLEFKNKHFSGFSKSFKSGLPGFFPGESGATPPPPVPSVPGRFH